MKIKTKKKSIEFDKATYDKLSALAGTNSDNINDIVFAFMGLSMEAVAAEKIYNLAKKQGKNYHAVKDLDYYEQLAMLYEPTLEKKHIEREPFFSRKKISIDFTDRDYAMLERYCNIFKTKSGNAVNEFATIIFSLPDTVKRVLGIFFMQLKEQEVSRVSELPGYLAAVCNRRISMYSKAMDILNVDPVHEASETMQIVEIKSGKCIFPKEWIVLDNLYPSFGSPSECEYASVIECRNGAKFGMPHFVFFSTTPTNLISDADEEPIHKAATEKFEKYAEVKALELDVNGVDAFGKDLKTGEQRFTIEEWKASPTIGIFPIVTYGDPLFWNSLEPDYEPPYGAMIVKEEK